jgi:membrane fusion protein (multidrug efflux system)
MRARSQQEGAHRNPSPTVGVRALVVLGLLLGIACGKGPEKKEVAAAGVTLAAVQARDLEERIEATGEMRAKDSARIAAEVAGRVTETPYEEGSRVAAGTIVMRIDPERHRLERDGARAGLAEAEASLKEQQRALDRMRELHAGKVASQERLDQAETATTLGRAKVEETRARLSMAERAHADASVAAPFAGLIGRRLVSRGEYVQPGQALFELVALDPIEVEFRLAEKDVARVKPGVPVDVRVAPYPDQIFRATVTVVAPTVDPQSRTLRVRAELPNPDGRLRPGLFARADLGVSQRTGVAMIPEEAVLQRADGAVIFRMNGADRVERRVIEVGIHDGGSVEVLHGLAPGDRVVTRGHTALVDGAMVEVRNPDGSVASEVRP